MYGIYVLLGVLAAAAAVPFVENNELTNQVAAGFSNRIEGNRYVITVPVSVANVKDLSVKSDYDFIIVYACNILFDKEKYCTKTHLSTKIIPDFVSSEGTWIYDNGFLMISFPLKDPLASETVTEVTVTKQPPTMAMMDTDSLKDISHVDGEQKD